MPKETFFTAISRWRVVSRRALVYAFPHARLAAQEQERDTVEQESHAFCEKQGMPFGTREHTVCIEDLMDIRANERQRTLADLGIF